MGDSLTKVLDPVQVYEAYVMFGGNCVKVSAACDVTVETVQQLALLGKWDDKIQSWKELTDGNVQAVQVAINRGVNYIQATRLRALIDKVVQYLSEGTKEELIDRLTTQTKDGPVFKTRAITDLTKAAETAQLMTQRALGDNPSLEPESKERKGSSIALSVLAALNASKDISLDSVDVVKKQLNDIPRNTPAKGD